MENKEFSWGLILLNLTNTFVFGIFFVLSLMGKINYLHNPQPIFLFMFSIFYFVGFAFSITCFSYFFKNYLDDRAKNPRRNS
jgi:hypothetical protein